MACGLILYWVLTVYVVYVVYLSNQCKNLFIMNQNSIQMAISFKYNIVVYMVFVITFTLTYIFLVMAL